MKIGNHIGLQTATLVGAAALLALVIEEQSSVALRAREQVQGDARDLESFERFAGGARHLLLAGDLVLSGGTTYLAPVVEEQAASLQRILGGLTTSPLLADRADACGALGADVDALSAIVAAALEVDGEDRDRRLFALLEDFDARSIEMTTRIDELRADLSGAVEARRLEVDERVAHTRLRSLAGMLVFVGVILLAWTYLRHVLGSPIRRLAREVRGARAGTPFVTPRGGPTEVRDLAAGFAELVQGLEHARDGLEATVAERTDDLERALAARSAFLANTSHELRTPMNAILGFTELLLAPASSEEERTEYLHHLRASGQHLMSLIEDVLDLTKIDAGHMLVERIAFSPRDVLSEVDAMLASTATGKGLEFETRVAPDLPERLMGDPIRLRQVLVNLVGNAIKFTASGAVRVELEWRARELHLAVEDTGPGIPASRLEAIFESFEQVDASNTRRFGGSGLGLAISRELVHLMGGELTVRSKEGIGSTFRVALPAPRARAGADEESALRAIGPPAGTRVLLVDDVPTNLLVGRRQLERLRCVVTEARDGADAILAVEHARASGQPFDAILMDLQMPGIDGLEATRRILADGYDGPVIALSAAVMAVNRAEAGAAGCVAFLAKPIDLNNLTRVLGEHVASARAESRVAPRASA